MSNIYLNPTRIEGGNGMSMLVKLYIGRHKCRQWGCIFTYWLLGGCNCITVTSGSQKKSFTKHISRQLGHLFFKDTEQCSHPMPLEAITVKSRPSNGIIYIPPSSPYITLCFSGKFICSFVPCCFCFS